MIKDESKKIAEGIFIREVTLEDGKYAFVSLGVASQMGLGEKEGEEESKLILIAKGRTSGGSCYLHKRP